MTMRKRRAVRLPLTDVVRNAMIRTLPRYEPKDEYSKENSPYNNGDIAVIWIQYKWNKANGECPLCATKCDNGKWYLDLVFTDENVGEGFVTPKCRTLYRVEKYQMRNLDFYLSDWIEDLRMIEYMYDAETAVHHDCYDALFDPTGFYCEQRIVPYRIVDEMLIDIVEETGKADLLDNLEELDTPWKGYDPYSQAALVDRFVLNIPNRSVYWTYYNPDSDAGGQFVSNTITFDQINEAPTNNPDSFFDHLGSVAKQTLTDVNTPNFVDTAYQVLTEPSDLMGCSESTMVALKRIASKYR